MDEFSFISHGILQNMHFWLVLPRMDRCFAAALRFVFVQRLSLRRRQRGSQEVREAHHCC